MGTITGTSIINKVSTLLYDVQNVRWSRTELLGWLNDAQRAMVLLYPEASFTVQSVQLQAGTRQYIPSTGWILLTATSNMGTNGTNRGRALKKVERDKLDETNPTWYSDPAQSAPTQFMYDERDRTAFDVYPPADGTGWVEIIYSAYPVDLSTEAGTIVVLDIYEPAIIDYMMFRALSKNADFTATARQEAAAYYENFMSYIGQSAKDVSKAAGSAE